MSKFIKIADLSVEQLKEIGLIDEKIRKIKGIKPKKEIPKTIEDIKPSRSIIEKKIIPNKKNRDQIKYPEHWDQKLRSKYCKYLQRDRVRKMNLGLTFEQFESLLKGNCVYCGSSEGITIDRRDSNVGYEPYNCHSCCKTCNVMKYWLSEYTFLEKVAQIYHHQTNPPLPSLGG